MEKYPIDKKYDDIENLKENPNDEFIVYFQSGVLVLKINRPKKRTL